MMFRSGMRRWRPADGWQGTGATHVATNAATRLTRLSRTPKTKLHFKTLHTIAKMLALRGCAQKKTQFRVGRGGKLKNSKNRCAKKTLKKKKLNCAQKKTQKPVRKKNRRAILAVFR